MKKRNLLRWCVGPALGLVVLGAAAALVLPWLGERKAARTLNVQPAAVAYASDPGAVQRGRYLYLSRGCADCHGADAAGRVFIDDPNGLRLRGANLTTGRGSAVANYREVDWVRAIRHGVKPDGRPLIVMPSEDYNRLTDADLADVVTYVRGLPAVDAGAAEIRLPRLVKALYAVGVVQDAAEKIDHTLPPSRPVPVAPSVGHGRYVANACIGCHGPGLAGGRIPGGPPDWPPASNLTPGEGSVMPRYANAQTFKEVLRTGRRPDGSAVNAAMPTGALRHMNDVDIDALHAYLATLQPRPAGTR